MGGVTKNISGIDTSAAGTLISQAQAYLPADADPAEILSLATVVLLNAGVDHFDGLNQARRLSIALSVTANTIAFCSKAKAKDLGLPDDALRTIRLDMITNMMAQLITISKTSMDQVATTDSRRRPKPEPEARKS